MQQQYMQQQQKKQMQYQQLQQQYLAGKGENEKLQSIYDNKKPDKFIIWEYIRYRSSRR